MLVKRAGSRCRRSEPGVGRHDLAGEVLAPDPAVAVDVLGGEQAWPVEVEERRQGGLGEAVDVVGEAPRDIRLVPIPWLDVHRLVAFHEGAKLLDSA